MKTSILFCLLLGLLPGSNLLFGQTPPPAIPMQEKAFQQGKERIAVLDRKQLADFNRWGENRARALNNYLNVISHAKNPRERAKAMSYAQSLFFDWEIGVMQDTALFQGLQRVDADFIIEEYLAKLYGPDRRHPPKFAWTRHTEQQPFHRGSNVRQVKFQERLYVTRNLIPEAFKALLVYFLVEPKYIHGEFKEIPQVKIGHVIFTK
ncbi:MAG: hypothetical protein AAFR61_05445 [Bacteroidota bacterium]